MQSHVNGQNKYILGKTIHIHKVRWGMGSVLSTLQCNLNKALFKFSG